MVKGTLWAHCCLVQKTLTAFTSIRNKGLKSNTGLDRKEIMDRGNWEIHFKCMLLIWTQTHPESTIRNVYFSPCSSDSTGRIDLPLPMFLLSLKKTGLPCSDSSMNTEPYIIEYLWDLAKVFALSDFYHYKYDCRGQLLLLDLWNTTKYSIVIFHSERQLGHSYLYLKVLFILGTLYVKSRLINRIRPLWPLGRNPFSGPLLQTLRQLCLDMQELLRI